VVYVGIDLHRRSSHVAAFDEDGLELLSRRVANDPVIADFDRELAAVRREIRTCATSDPRVSVLTQIPQGHELLVSLPAAASRRDRITRRASAPRTDGAALQRLGVRLSPARIHANAFVMKTLLGSSL
jgi:hypothetical protein